VEADEDDEPDVAQRWTPAATSAGPGRSDAGPTVALPSWRPDRPGATTVLGTYGGPERSEDATQRIAPLPFGGPPPEPPRRAFEPAPGPQPHDPVLPGDLLADRPPAERRRRTVAALLTAIGLLLAAVVGGALLLHGIGPGGDSGTGTAEPSAGATGPATLPAGYSLYKGDGFTVGVPAAWKPATARTGVVDVTEPGSDHRFLRLITVRGSNPALEQLTGAEQQFAANKAYAPYEQVRLQGVDYRGYDAADWEFTFGAPQRHVLYRGIVVDGKTYGLYLSVPASRWAESKAVFQVATDSFRLTS
jgi:hypothetical protein